MPKLSIEELYITDGLTEGLAIHVEKPCFQHFLCECLQEKERELGENVCVRKTSERDKERNHEYILLKYNNDDIAKIIELQLATLSYILQKSSCYV